MPAEAVSCAVQLQEATWQEPYYGPEIFRSLTRLADGSILQVESDHIYLVDRDRKSRRELALPELQDGTAIVAPLAGGDALLLQAQVFSDRGKASLHRYDHIKGKFRPAIELPPDWRGRTKKIHALPESNALIVVSSGDETVIWRFDGATDTIRLLSKFDVSDFSELAALPRGDAILLNTKDQFLHVYKHEKNEFQTIPFEEGSSRPRIAYSVLALPNGEALVAATTFDPDVAQAIRYFRYGDNFQSRKLVEIVLSTTFEPPSRTPELNSKLLPRWSAWLPSNRAILSKQDLRRTLETGSPAERAVVVNYESQTIEGIPDSLDEYRVVDLHGYKPLIFLGKNEAKLVDRTTLRGETLFLPADVGERDLRKAIIDPDGTITLQLARPTQIRPQGVIRHTAKLLSQPEIGTNPTQWQVEGPCTTYIEEKMLAVYTRADKAEKENGLQRPTSTAYDLKRDPKSGAFTFWQNINIPEPGTWELQVYLSLDYWQPEAISEPQKIVIERNALAWLRENADVVSYAALGIYFSFFALLLIASRWSSKAFRIVCDPFWRRASLLLWPLLSHFAFAQRWVMSPWYARARQKYSESRPYLQIPLRSAIDPRSFTVAELFNLTKLTRLICIQGKSGMGKTALVDRLMETYFESQSLTEAYRKHGFVLLSIRARRHALVDDSSRRKEWVLDAVQSQLMDHGLKLADKELLETMLETGQFTLLIDGVNEVQDLRDALAEFATNKVDAVRMIVTSQSEMSQPFDLLRLPSSIVDHVKGLLELKMGTRNGGALYTRLSESGLLGELSSGYDVQLVADLARTDTDGTALPVSRIGLYRAVLADVRMADGSKANLEMLLSIAWEMICGQTRRTTKENLQRLGQPTFDAIVAARAPIIQVYGQAVEFRHDLMRAFLAAEWLVSNSPSSAALTSRISESEIWQSPKRDQDELWTFLRDIAPAQWIEPLWHFAIAEPNRGYLQRALQERADALGLNLSRNPHV